MFREEDLTKIRVEARKIKVEYAYSGEKNDNGRHITGSNK
jgi:hypothetical protein